MEKDNNDFYAKFIEALKGHVPRRGNLCRMLTEILNIERISVYRRLRGDVPFTVAEISLIARKFNVSLDKLMGIAQPYRSLPFNLHHQDFFALTDTDYKMGADYVAAINAATTQPYSEFGCASNFVPLHTMALYEPIYRFMILKWRYQFGTKEQKIPYHQVQIPRRLRELHRQYIEAVQKIKYTYLIYNEFSLSHLVHDILFFRDLNMITHEEVRMLKDTLEKSLKNMDQLMNTGAYNNGNRVDIYSSGLNFETSYSYLFADGVNISMVDAFTLGAITSLDSNAADIMRRWMYSMKRTSTLITNNERNRIIFLDKLRKTIGKLAS
ncbi:MAG: hypothetical protein LBR64_10675 [Dysgonamonadaceae bacterium]|jgi:hypothetical protein|nr:hypothetical protein [Dysgonamonadaceae bacterium]